MPTNENYSNSTKIDQNTRMMSSIRRSDTFKNINSLQSKKMSPGSSPFVNDSPTRKKRVSGVNNTLLPNSLGAFHTKNLDEIKLNLENKYQKQEQPRNLKEKLTVSYPNYVLEQDNIFGKKFKRYFTKVISPTKLTTFAKISEGFVFFCVFVDSIILSLMRPTIKKSEIIYYEIAENILIFIYLGESIIRIMSNGFKKYWSNFFNKIDTIIICLNVFFLFHSYSTKTYLYESDSGYVVLSLKTLRVFRFIVGMNWWAEGAMLFIEMIHNLKKMLSFIVIIFIILIIMTFIAMQLFAYRVSKTNVE